MAVSGPLGKDRAAARACSAALQAVALSPKRYSSSASRHSSADVTLRRPGGSGDAQCLLEVVASRSFVASMELDHGQGTEGQRHVELLAEGAAQPERRLRMLVCSVESASV